MKTSSLRLHTSDELVRAYEEVAVLQSRSFEQADTEKFNKEFEVRQAIVEELRSRPDDQRELLASLFAHPKSWVRICVAQDTFSLSPERARRHMQYVADHARAPFRGEALTALGCWDRGLTPR